MLLAACASKPPEPPQPPCTLTQADAETRFPSHFPYIFVPVRFGKTTVAFIFDTGAVPSVITPQAAKALNLKLLEIVRSGRHLRLNALGVGAAGVFKAGLVVASSVQFGNGFLPSGLFTVAPVFNLPLARSPIYGVIGSNIIANWAVEIDESHGVLNLFNEDLCRVTGSPWPDRAAQVRLDSDDVRPHADIQIGTRPLTAVLDTGAPSSLLHQSSASLLGLETRHDPVVPIGGFGLETVSGHSHRLADVRLGGVEIGPIPVAVIPQTVDHWDLLLGEDFFRRYRVFISYRQRLMFFAPTIP